MQKEISYATESQLQAAFWQESWNRYPHARHHMWSVPNDAIGAIFSQKDWIQAKKMKATGMLEGVWDLHLFWKGALHVIETKLPGGRLSIERIDNGRKHYGQKEWGEKMASHGAVRHIYHTLEEGLAMFESIVGHADGAGLKK